uniref:Elongation factor G n=1 Tax=Lygus hesperus TaxID=30085 RepID=A0A0A9ZF76_LYGHE
MPVLQRLLEYAVLRVASCGPRGLPLCGVRLVLHSVTIGVQNSVASMGVDPGKLAHIFDAPRNQQLFISLLSNLVLKAVRENVHTCVLDPVGEVVINTPARHSSSIVGDIATRNGTVVSIDLGNSGNSDDTTIVAHVPMRALHRYASVVRSLSHGDAFFTLQFHHFAPTSYLTMDGVYAS